MAQTPAPLATFLPGTQSKPFTGFIQPQGVAIDGSGNIYITDPDGGIGPAFVYKETLSGGTYTQSTIGSGFFEPWGVAVDSSGNVYVADFGQFDRGPSDTRISAVYKLTPAGGGTYTQTTISSNFVDLDGIAIDSNGNLYVADYGCAVGSCEPAQPGGIYKLTPAGGGTYTQTTLVANLTVSNVALDSSGNLYYTIWPDSSHSSGVVYKRTPAGVTSTVVSGLVTPESVAVTPNGTVYVADDNNVTNGFVYKETPDGDGTYTQSTLINDGVNGPESVVLDKNGNLYIAMVQWSDTYPVDGAGFVYKEDYADPPSLSFADTNVGSTSSSQTVTVNNIGNAALNFEIPGSGNNPNISSGFTLASGGSGQCPVVTSGSGSVGTLAAGASCALTVAFAPQATGSYSGSTLVLTDNNANAAPPYATQTIDLNGTATGTDEVSHLEITGSSLVTAGVQFSITVKALDALEHVVTGYTGTVRFTSSDSAATLPANSTLPSGTGTFNLTLKTAGSQTVTATDTATPTVTDTIAITVDAGTATHLAISAPSSATSGTSFGITVSAFDGFGNLATSYPGTVHFTSTDGSASLPANRTLSSGQGSLTATLNTAGSQTITATDTVTPSITGTSNSITVGQATSITSAASDTFTVGTSGTFTVTASGSPAPTFTETGALPSGVTLASSGVLSGTPAAGTGGNYPITITASNGVGTDAMQSFTLTVHQSPAITSASSATFTAGSTGSFTVTASGYPSPTFTETGALPSGVTLSSGGTLSGTPAAGTGGSYPITITASNGVGTNATQSFTLTVGQAPAITSVSGATFAVGSPGSFTVTASGSPAPTFTETGTLPGGVTLSSGGTLSGTPAAGTGGSYPLTITASNGVGANATQSFILTVGQAPAITSANSTTFAANQAGTFTVTAIAFPTAALSESGTLPSGVTFTDNGNGTATLAGTPGASTAGPYPFTITAGNGINPNATQSFTLTVNPPPSYVVTTATDDASGIAANCPSGGPSGGGGLNCSLRDALAAASAAGGAAVSFDSTVFAAGNSVAQNTITLGSGGTLSIPSNTTITGATTGSGAALTNLVTVSGNKATTVFIVNSGVAGATIGNLTIANGIGSSSYGGGGILNEGALTVTNSTFSGNSASGAFSGGAIFNYGDNDAATLTVANSTFSGNSASGAFSGGAIFNYGDNDAATLTVTNSTFSGNSAFAGDGSGAIFNYGEDAAATLTVTNSTFYANSAAEINDAGAISILGTVPPASTSLTVTNNIFSGNSATGNNSAGAISGLESGESATFTDSNNIFWNNTGATTNDCYGCTETITDANPQLASLGNYGGPTQTMIPLPGSAAICAINPSTATGTDQRGLPRITTYGTTTCQDAGSVQTQYAIAFVQQPTTVVQNATMTPAVTATVLDHGLAIPGAAVNLTLNGTGALGGTLPQSTDATGTATFVDLTVSAAGTNDTLTASSGATLTVNSDMFNVTPAVTQLAFSTAPTATLTAGGDAGASVTVQEETASGSLVSTASDTVTLTVTGPNSYSKSYTETAINGAATFNLSSAALTAAGSYVYTASISASPSVTVATANETVTVGSPASVAVVSGSGQSAIIGAAFAAPLKVKVEDSNSNPVAGATVTFTAPSSGASASLGGSPATTASDGTASVTATANGIVGATAYTVTANVTGATSADFTLTNTQHTTTLTVTPSPSTPVYGQPVSIMAAIAPTAVAGSSPTGTVTFYDGSTALTPASAVSGASASYMVSVPTVGSHSYAAEYGGDNNFSQSALTHAAASLTIGMANSTLSGPTSPVSLTYGAGGTIAIAIAGQYSGAGIATPSGSLSYTIGGGATQTAVITSGTATLTISASQAEGSYTVAVSYNGDTNYNASTPINVGLAIGHATLTLTAGDVSRTYGTANPTFTGTVTGQQNGDTFTESFSTAATLSSPVGSYAIVPSATGANLANYTQSVTNGTLIVTQAATTTTLGASSPSITPGQSETLTAQVASATTGTPTGTVSFYDGTTFLSTVPLSGGTASYSITTLAPGVTHIITATYSGDTNFTVSSSTSSASVTVAMLDFTMAISGPSSATVVPGRTISYQVAVTPDYGSYAGTVNFAVSGLPPGATATFSPSSIAANGGTQTVTITIQTAPATALDRTPPGPSPGRHAASVSLALLALFGLGGLRRRGHALKRFLCVVALLTGGAAATFSLSGCGSSNGFFNQAPQNYNITITATAASLQHSATVMLNVQ